MNAKLEKWHFRLGIAGMTPVVGIVFDATDAALYAFSGEYGEAVFAVLAAIPGIGDLGKAARTTVKVGEQTKDVVVLSQKQIDLVTKEVEKKPDEIKKVTDKSNPHIVDDQAAFVHVVSGGKGGLNDLTKRIKLKMGLYPKIIDPRTGRQIKFPTNNLYKIDKSQRVTWDSQDRYKFIKEWNDRGYQTPRGGWNNYDIHHIQPIEFGGSNQFQNLVPVERKTHQKLFNEFWREFVE